MIKRILFLGFVCISFLLAMAPESPISKSAAYSGSKTISNISNWACWIFDNGKSAHSPDGSSGAFYPNGTEAAPIYQDGFIWGGKVDTDDDGIADRIRVGGQQYNIGTVPGWVISGGDVSEAIVADPGDPAVRIYRIRRDYEHMSDNEIREDAAIQNDIYNVLVTDEMKQAVFDQYQQDWDEWPVDRGAPYVDKDHDGIYTPGVDEPGIANADQVIWFVVNDYDRTKTTAMFGSEPIGLELQVTIWAYDDERSRFGQSIYKSYKLINKSNSTVEDMYITQWSDPDVGSARDDYVGCDTLLNMGFAYNANEHDGDYDIYGLVPPAAGYVLLQGPMIESPGDTAVYELNDVTGYKNLPMTSFGWFGPISAICDPELGDYIGTLQYYNLLKGYKPTEDIDDPVPWTLGNVAGAQETKYPLHGDPTIPGETEVDGSGEYFSPSDRRMCVSSGPFDLEPGDCQEVIFALVGGIGEDHLSSITELKTNAELAKLLYDGKFKNVGNAPEQPDVTARYFEKTVVLEWGSNRERVEEIENYSIAGYEFEGYNVYQLAFVTDRFSDATRIATYDVINDVKIINDIRWLEEFDYEEAEVPVAFGDDTGIQRYIRLDWDYIDHCPLYEGKTYYYAVTSYNQNLSEDRMGARMYESDLMVHAVKLQEELPGNKLQSYSGQSDFEINRISGDGEGSIFVKVVDPFAITGDDYSIRFEYDDDSSGFVFSIWNETNGLMLSDGNDISRDTLTHNGATIVDGLEIKAISAEEGLKRVAEYDENYNLVDESVSICNMSLGSTGYLFSNPAIDCNLEPYAQDFDRYNVRDNDNIEIDFTDSSVAWQYLNDECLEEKVPFAMYRWPNGHENKERLYIVIFDEGWGDTSLADGLSSWDITGTDNIWGVASTYEPIFAYVGPTPYDPLKEAEYLAANDIKEAPSSTGMGIYSYMGNPGYPVFTSGIIIDYWEGGYPIDNKVIFETNKILDYDDKFQFSTAGYEPIQSDSLLLEAIDRINVYPNPYYGFDGFGNSDFERHVTFTHLPEKATITIFNLAGICVNILEHNGGQFETWYLGNFRGVRVGSGMYIAHIDMPDIGKEKILKFMIVRGTHN